LNLIVGDISTAGVLLSGRKSLRMGQGEAQIEFRGQTLISWALVFQRLSFASVLIVGDRHQVGETGGSETQGECPDQHQVTGGKRPLRLRL